MTEPAKDTIVFVNLLPSVTSSYAKKGAAFPSTAIMQIGSLLSLSGFRVKIIDGGLDKEYIAGLRAFLSKNRDAILFVGLSVMTTQVPMALETSRIVKGVDKNLAVVWGGPHPTLFPDQTLADETVDIISINEGSEAALGIARALQNGGDLAAVKGIGYKPLNGEPVFNEKGELDNFNDLPPFDYNLIETKRYVNSGHSVFTREFPGFAGQIKSIPLLTALGCPYKCQFCFNVILRRRYRFRSADWIVREIKRAQAEFDANTIIFLDEDFFISKRRVFEFLELVEKEQLHFNWRMWCRVDHFKEDYLSRCVLERLADIGHGSMVMGGESGNQEILDRLKKGITTGQIINSLEALEGLRITPRYSFMVGLEDETLGQIMNTYRFCFLMKKINPKVDIAGPFVFRLYPGSPIFNRLTEKYQLRIPGDLESWRPFLLENETTYTHMPWAPKKFRGNIKYIQFYSLLALQARGDSISLKSVAIRWLSILARWRIHRFVFSFPVEFWGVQWIGRAMKKRG